MIDAIASGMTGPVEVYALAGTIAALQEHVFNDVIWPDFTRIPSEHTPFVRFREISIGQVLDLGGKRIEVLPALHTVPAVGYSVSAGRGCWVFTGDTGPNPAFWDRLSRIDVAVLVIETAFSNRETELAERSLHLAPQTLSHELESIGAGRRRNVKPMKASRLSARLHITPWIRGGSCVPNSACGRRSSMPNGPSCSICGPIRLASAKLGRNNV